MSLYLNISFLPKSFPKALELWQLADFSNGLLTYEQLVKLENVNKCTTINTENFIKSQARDVKRGDGFCILHSEQALKASHRIDFMHVRDWHVDQLYVKGFDKLIQARDAWWGGVLSHPNFLMARLMSNDYDSRQNSKSLQFYEVNGWPHAHLPKISNGMPPPIDEIIVDTRVNPGHWRFKPGYIEGVAAQMWLGRAFFNAVNLDKSALFDVPWLEVDELACGVIHIKAYDSEFDSDQGEQRDIQIKLRKLLFGQSPHSEDGDFKQLSEWSGWR